MQDKITNILKNSEGYLSGEEISRILKISRAGIWKNIQELRKQGYDIVAVPHLGYQLRKVPDKLYSSEIKYHLKTEFMGQKIDYFPSIDSTMNKAFQSAMDGAPEGSVVICEHQSAGRGRLGRSWESPSGVGVYMSIILRPNFSAMETAKLTLMTAVAVSESIEEVCEISPQIKWPNDVLINGQKICGILTELRAELDSVRFVVIGLGLNVNNTDSQLLDTAVSLRQVVGKKISRVEVVQNILVRMEYWYKEIHSNGFESLITEWKARSSTLGKEVSISGSAGEIRGKAVELDQDGGLIIQTPDGNRVKRMAGDVTTY